MTRPLLLATQILLGALLAAGPASAVVAPPMIAEGTPFPIARAALAKSGIVPVPVLRGGAKCGKTGCPRPEPIACYGSLGQCRWVFADRANDALYLVDVFVLRRPHAPPVEDYLGIRFATPDELGWEDITVVLPSGARRRFRPPPPPKGPPPQPPTPLCSDVPPHTLPCWVKPPPDYRGGSARRR
jgi:hypothetical protein